MLKEPMLNKLSTCNAIAQQPLTREANTAPYQLVHRDYFAATMTHSGGWPSLVTQPPSTAVPLGAINFFALVIFLTPIPTPLAPLGLRSNHDTLII